jgi:hypothetical protein
MNVILTVADKSIAIFWNTGGKRPVFQLQARNQLVSADGKIGKSLLRRSVLIVTDVYCSLILMKIIAVFWNTGGKSLSSGFTQRISWVYRRVYGKKWEVSSPSLGSNSVQNDSDSRCRLRQDGGSIHYLPSCYSER